MVGPKRRRSDLRKRRSGSAVGSMWRRRMSGVPEESNNQPQRGRGSGGAEARFVLSGRRQQCPNNPQPRRPGSGGAEAWSTDRQRRSGSKCILWRGVSRPAERGPRSRLQQSSGTGRRWRGRRQQSGGGGAERRSKQGAARRGPTQTIKLRLIRSSCKRMKS